MTASIIQFPKNNKPKSAISVDLCHCWDARLNNPLLNKLYKHEVSYVERWFLQITHLLNTENSQHPLIQVILSDDNILQLLHDLTAKDLAIHEHMRDLSSIYVTKPNIIKLYRWLAKWKSLLRHKERLS